MQVKNKIPTTIFSGFLGSGKTTIINSLIDQLLKNGEKVAYVKNEIGDEDVDGKIIRGKNIKTKELLNGCICCTLVGPFINSIYELVESAQPDRIIIEASGASDPSAIALMVTSHPLLLRDGVIAVIDVLNFDGYKDLSLTARSQARFTDLIVFNKTELADMDRKIAVVGYVRELNSISPIIETKNGEVEADLIFGVGSQHLINMLNSLNAKNDKDLNHQRHHLEEDKIETFFCQVSKKFNDQELNDFLNYLPKNIIRVKGFVKYNDDQIKIVNKVGGRSTIESLDKHININGKDLKLVFIGFSINEYKNEIEKKLID